MSTPERVVDTGCDNVDCPVVKCGCICHTNSSVMHMFACCATRLCETCGTVVPGTVDDGGVYYKENK